MSPYDKTTKWCFKIVESLLLSDLYIWAQNEPKLVVRGKASFCSIKYIQLGIGLLQFNSQPIDLI